MSSFVQSNRCPAPATPSSCSTTGRGCYLPYTLPSAKLSCTGGSTGGGNLPNGPLDKPICGVTCETAEVCDIDTVLCALSPLARIVVAVVRLANPDGSSPSDITVYHNEVLCTDPQSMLSELTVEALLRNGTGRGVFARVGESSYKVYSFFASLPSNQDLLVEFGSNYQLCLGMFCSSASS